MKKLLVHGSWFMVAFLITMNYQPITSSAQELCLYPEYCDEGGGPASGQHSCTGVKVLREGVEVCEYNPAVEPNCSSCEPILTPTPVTTPSATLIPTPQTITHEEQAVANLNQGLLPKEASGSLQPEEKNLLNRALNTVGELWNNLKGLFHNQPQKPGTLLIQSGAIHQASTPEELKPPSAGNPIDWVRNQLQGFLGKSTGFYGVSLPKVEGTEETIKAREDLYQKANFPEGIKPVTGQ